MKTLISQSAILTAEQMRAVDAATIRDEPIASIDLMERAALHCVRYLQSHYDVSTVFQIFCGCGDNGGDGLAITRLLLERGYRAHAYWVDYSAPMSADARTNFQRLQNHYLGVLHHVTNINEMPEFNADDVVIDALLGTGTTRSPSGILAQAIARINANTTNIIAIDMPSGLLADAHTPNDWPVIHASHTLTFECAKPALLYAENAERVGEWQIVPIGLSAEAIAAHHSPLQLITPEWIAAHQKARPKFSHKGTFGHALLVAGAYGTVGAAILSAHACLRSGVGLLTVHSPKCAYVPLQTAVPEAMVQADSHETEWHDAMSIDVFNSVGIGCGIGQSAHTRSALRQLLLKLSKKPMPPALILDADALNILASEPDLFAPLPKNTVLTPHPKEFDRLVAHLNLPVDTNAQRHAAQLILAKQYQLIVVLKGANTCVATPDGLSFFNTTGNPGMAKGGSGDALTGVILALLAQGHAPASAAIIGVYLHGKAGDAAAEKWGTTAMLPSDLIECLR